MTDIDVRLTDLYPIGRVWCMLRISEEDLADLHSKEIFNSQHPEVNRSSHIMPFNISSLYKLQKEDNSYIHMPNPNEQARNQIYNDLIDYKPDPKDTGEFAPDELNNKVSFYFNNIKYRHEMDEIINTDTMLRNKLIISFKSTQKASESVRDFANQG